MKCPEASLGHVIEKVVRSGQNMTRSEEKKKHKRGQETWSEFRANGLTRLDIVSH